MSTQTLSGVAEQVGQAPSGLASVMPAIASSFMKSGLSALERAADFATVAGLVYAALVSVCALSKSVPCQMQSPEHLVLACALAFMFVLLLERHGDYKPYLSLMGVRETERLLRAGCESTVLASVSAHLLNLQLSTRLAATIFAVTTVAVFFEKRAMHAALTWLRNRGYGTRNAVILGTGSLARMLYTALICSPKLGLNPVVLVDEDDRDSKIEIYELAHARPRQAKVYHGQVCCELLQQLHTSALIVADHNAIEPRLAELFDLAKRAGATLHFAANDFFGTDVCIEYDEVDGVALGRYSGPSSRVRYEVLKRCLDVAIALVALVLCSPLLALVALLVKLTSQGPVIFRQERVGKNGKPFTILKFRSMYVDAPPYQTSPQKGADPRITTLGRVLRRTHVDEFPQLFNVFAGDMSLVGPRPEMPFLVEQYSAVQRRRLAVKPGMTGLWQLSADRADLIHRNVEYDLYYLINNPRFLLEITGQLIGVRKFEVTR